MVKLRTVKSLTGYKLYLEYGDGVTGEVDLSHLAGKGVFVEWNDPAVFEAVTVGSHGEIRWTENLEICADALYLELTGKETEELFPNLKTHADAKDAGTRMSRTVVYRTRTYALHRPRAGGSEI